MTIPVELEERLSAQAARRGVSLSDHVLQVLSTIGQSDSENGTPRIEPSEKPPRVMFMEVVHSLAERTSALGAETRRRISTEPDQLARYGSIYRLLEGRFRSGEIRGERLLTLLGIVLREMDLYQSYLANLLGSIDWKSPLQVRKRPFDLVLLVREVVDLFAFLAAEKGVEINFDEEAITIIPLDYLHVQRLLVNIIDNAVKYSYRATESGSRRFIAIKVRRHNPQGDQAVSVQSFGVGILQEEMSSIFEYGIRGRLAYDRFRGGTGIGLAEAKKIADAHGGHIHIKSERLDLRDVYLTTVTVVFPQK